MKSLFLKIVNWKLALLARMTVKKYKPTIVGITGSVGKTSTKAAIYTILKANGVKVRVAGGNLNNETGLPLSILGNYKTPGGAIFLAKAIFRGFIDLISPEGARRYPEILVLEYAADKPGDLDYLISVAKPDIAVVTAVGEVPVHLEFYENVAQVELEKKKLVEAVPEEGMAILNADDNAVRRMKTSTTAKVRTYGFTKDADLHISALKTKLAAGKPVGITFKLTTTDDTGDVSLESVLGKAPAYAAASAAAVALTAGVSLEQSATALALHRGEKGRGRIIEGIKDTTIIDDSYNASPDSMRNALEILAGLKSTRRIAVLGDMLELGDLGEAAHKDLGQLAGKSADVLITVGPLMESAAEEAKKKLGKNVASFAKANEAAEYLAANLKKNDLVLIKGSQSMRMEKIVKKVMTRPEDAKSLLVRQYGKWLKS